MEAGSGAATTRRKLERLGEEGDWPRATAGREQDGSGSISEGRAFLGSHVAGAAGAVTKALREAGRSC